MDIVERLRNWKHPDGFLGMGMKIREEAADEIERLRKSNEFFEALLAGDNALQEGLKNELATVTRERDIEIEQNRMLDLANKKLFEQIAAIRKDCKHYAHEFMIAKDALEVVTRERDALKQSCADETGYNNSLRVALDDCQKDAERYAVLRNFGFPNQTSHFGPWWWKDGGLFHTLDEAVDAKIAEMKEQTK